jgi:hypothetical protein
MALRRSIRAGEEITLRTRFTDDLDDPVQASDVLIYIFDATYSSGTTDYYHIADADYSGSPTYWEDGMFEYDFTPSNAAASDGIWHDVWYGTVNGQTVSGVFSFEVSADGSVAEIPSNQLYYNNIVTVTLASGIMATDGTALTNGYSFTFMTEITPAYTDYNKVMLEAGSVITDVTKDVVYMAILEASLEADQLTFVDTIENAAFYQHARREWTTCKAAAILASNIRSQLTAQSKTLGDFSVTYNPAGIDDLLDRIISCIKRWEPQLMTGGMGTQGPVNFIKGANDPDRPVIGRGWISDYHGDQISRRIPMANEKLKKTNERRWKKGYRNRWD